MKKILSSSSNLLVLGSTIVLSGKSYIHQQKVLCLSLCILAVCLSSNILAQSKIGKEGVSKRSAFKHAINVCPLAPLFGVYALNYEYLITPHNGLLARVEYEDVPKTYTDANIESNGMLYSLNYRRHFSPELNSFFAGAYVRYRHFKGGGEIENTGFDFKIQSVTIGLNAGKRWVWNNGINITVSAGYGFSKDNRKSTPSINAIENALNQLEKEYDFLSPLYPEISAGFAF